MKIKGQTTTAAEMQEVKVRIDCFAYRHKQGGRECAALKEMTCLWNDCPFYKPKGEKANENVG